MGNNNNADKLKEPLFVAFIGLITRALALPFTQQIAADAVSRIWIAWDWLSQPTFLTHGLWGPLHFYLLALSLFIGKEPVYSPIILHVLFSIGTAVLLFHFTESVFKHRQAALLTAVGFLFFPVAVRNSLNAMPETIFLFFIALTMFLLDKAMQEDGSISSAMGAGFSLTLAGMVRYEGWLLIPLLGIFLYRKKKAMLIFIAAASIFPITWLIGNQIQYNDALYSMHWSSNWELNIAGANEGLKLVDLVKRIFFFPAALVIGLTPLVSISALIGSGISLWKREASAKWLIPAAALLASNIIFGIQGSLDLQPRYIMSVGLFLLPFTARLFLWVKMPERRKQVWAVLLVGSMILLSYAGNIIAPQIARNFFSAAINPIPRLQSEDDASAILGVVEDNLRSEDGLIVDFMGWKKTYHILIMSRLHPKHVFVAPGEKYQLLDIDELKKVFGENHTGILILQEETRFSNQFKSLSYGILEFDDLSISIELIAVVEPDVNIFRYQVE